MIPRQTFYRDAQNKKNKKDDLCDCLREYFSAQEGIKEHVSREDCALFKNSHFGFGCIQFPFSPRGLGFEENLAAAWLGRTGGARRGLFCAELQVAAVQHQQYYHRTAQPRSLAHKNAPTTMGYREDSDLFILNKADN